MWKFYWFIFAHKFLSTSENNFFNGNSINFISLRTDTNQLKRFQSILACLIHLTKTTFFFLSSVRELWPIWFLFKFKIVHFTNQISCRLNFWLLSHWLNCYPIHIDSGFTDQIQNLKYISLDKKKRIVTYVRIISRYSLKIINLHETVTRY